MKQPRIAIVACKWYPMIGLEDARRGGYSMPSGAIVIPVRCVGVMKPAFLLRLFIKGFDGVLLLGCNEDDCRYLSGSSMCRRVADETRRLLILSGIEERRFCFQLMSEGSGEEFRRIFGRFTRKISPRGRSSVSAKGSR
ncbi:MAG: hydrogenase iron-sulfur subunit [bacterium]